MSLTSLHVLWQPTLGPLFEQSLAYGHLICLLITFRATFVAVDFSSFCLSLSPFGFELPALLPSYHVLFTESVCPEAFISPMHGNPGALPSVTVFCLLLLTLLPWILLHLLPISLLCPVDWRLMVKWDPKVSLLLFIFPEQGRSLHVCTDTWLYIVVLSRGAWNFTIWAPTDAHIQVTKGKWGSTQTNFT